MFAASSAPRDILCAVLSSSLSLRETPCVHVRGLIRTEGHTLCRPFVFTLTESGHPVFMFAASSAPIDILCAILSSSLSLRATRPVFMFAVSPAPRDIFCAVLSSSLSLRATPCVHVRGLIRTERHILCRPFVFTLIERDALCSYSRSHPHRETYPVPSFRLQSH